MGGVDQANGLPMFTALGNWADRGACRNAGVNMFPSGPRGRTAAKHVCAVCPVIEECRAWAMNQSTRLDGIWGGTTQRERRRYRKANMTIEARSAAA